MPATVTLTLVDGVRVVVPDSFGLLTTYVLQEQQDWFEDELRFLRHLLLPGQRAIDIGANCGIYTLTMAHRVGSAGRVWAFEPASRTAALLAAGIAANDAPQVVLERAALSATEGMARLCLNDNSETNALVRDDGFAGEVENVSLVTLDACMERFGWKDIDFLKIDAEGEEANILRGGSRFLAEESPLIQYEIRAGKTLQLELVREFSALGYQSYRLVPGLNLLIPFDAEEPADDYLLNLFCCKPDRAAQLAARGVLLEGAVGDLAPELAKGSINKWRDVLIDLPYGKLLHRLWDQAARDDGRRQVEQALSMYFLSQDQDLSSSARFAALSASLYGLQALCSTQPDHLRLASLARVARDYGARALAVKALRDLCHRLFQLRLMDPSEPFLAPGKRFDSLPPGNAFPNWIAAAAVEELERNQFFSSYYSAAVTLPRLETIRDLGFASDEMKRRLILVKARVAAARTANNATTDASP